MIIFPRDDADPCFCRASVVCLNYDAFHQAWLVIEQGFDVRAGHGRLKNNMFAATVQYGSLPWQRAEISGPVRTTHGRYMDSNEFILHD